MARGVSLSDLASEVVAIPQGWRACVNEKTYEVFAYPVDDPGIVDFDDEPDLDAPEWIEVRDPEADDDYRTMCDFATSQVPEAARIRLEDALQMHRPFHQFRAAVRALQLRDARCEFQEAAMAALIGDWLGRYEIPLAAGPSATT